MVLFFETSFQELFLEENLMLIKVFRFGGFEDSLYMVFGLLVKDKAGLCEFELSRRSINELHTKFLFKEGERQGGSGGRR